MRHLLLALGLGGRPWPRAGLDDFLDPSEAQHQISSVTVWFLMEQLGADAWVPDWPGITWQTKP